MNIFAILGIEAAVAAIDRSMTPVDTFGLLESRGDMQRVRSRKARSYNFYGDSWKKPIKKTVLPLKNRCGYGSGSTSSQDLLLQRKHYPLWGEKKRGTVLIVTRALTVGRDMFIPLPDASQGQPRVFRGSGTFAGSFGRLCRTAY